MKKIILLVLITAMATPAADWPCAGGNPMRTYNVEDPAFQPPSRLLWRYYTDGTGYMQPVYANSVLYTADQEGTIRALDGATGELLWQRYDECVQGCKSYSSELCFYNGSIAFVTGEYRQCNFICADARTGRTKWKVPVGPNPGKFNSPLGYRGRLYASGQNTLKTTVEYYALDTANGALLWKLTLPIDSGAVCAPPVIDTVRNMLFGSAGNNKGQGMVFAVDLTTLDTTGRGWTNHTLAISKSNHNIGLCRDTLYLTDAEKTGTALYDALTGTLLLQPHTLDVRAIAVTRDYIAAPFYGGDVWLMDRAGTVLASTQASVPDLQASSGCGAPLICNGYIVRGGGGRKAGVGGHLAVIGIPELLAKNNATMIKYRFQTNTNICATPVIGDGRVYFFGADGWIYCAGR